MRLSGRIGLLPVRRTRDRRTPHPEIWAGPAAVQEPPAPQHPQPAGPRQSAPAPYV